MSFDKGLIFVCRLYRIPILSDIINDRHMDLKTISRAPKMQIETNAPRFKCSEILTWVKFQ